MKSTFVLSGGVKSKPVREDCGTLLMFLHRFLRAFVHELSCNLNLLHITGTIRLDNKHKKLDQGSPKVSTTDFLLG